jgi:hypothetical protein
MSYPPQPPVPYPYSPQPVTAPTDLAIAAQLVAGGLALVQVVATVLAFPAARAIETSTADDVFDEPQVLFYELTNVVLIPTMLAAYVVTCLWLHKCRKNAELLAPDFRHERDSVWVWLGWWVPIVSFWFPFQVVRDVRRASTRDFGATNGRLGVWWACWLAFTLGSRVAGNIVPEDPDPAIADFIRVLEVADGVLVVGGLLLWLSIVREITRAQVALVGHAHGVPPTAR